MRIYHKTGGNARSFRWLRTLIFALLAVLILGTVGDIENGYVGVRAGALTLAALTVGLAVALAWPERRG